MVITVITQNFLQGIWWSMDRFLSNGWLSQWKVAQPIDSFNNIFVLTRSFGYNMFPVRVSRSHVVPLAIKKQLFSTPKAGSLFASEMRSLAEWDWLTSYMISGSLYIGNVQYFVNLTLPNLYFFQTFLLFQFSKYGLTGFENGRFFLFRDPSWSNWWLQKVGKPH